MQQVAERTARSGSSYKYDSSSPDIEDHALSIQHIYRHRPGKESFQLLYIHLQTRLCRGQRHVWTSDKGSPTTLEHSFKTL